MDLRITFGTLYIKPVHLKMALEVQNPCNKNMRQSNAFLRAYYTDLEFRTRVHDESANACINAPAAEVKRHIARMSIRDKKAEAGWIGPEPGKTAQEHQEIKKEKYQSSPEHRERTKAAVNKWRLANLAKVAEARRVRYATDEAYREKVRIARMARTVRERESREAAREAARLLEAAEKLDMA